MFCSWVVGILYIFWKLTPYMICCGLHFHSIDLSSSVQKFFSLIYSHLSIFALLPVLLVSWDNVHLYCDETKLSHICDVIPIWWWCYIIIDSKIIQIHFKIFSSGTVKLFAKKKNLSKCYFEKNGIWNIALKAEIKKVRHYRFDSIAPHTHIQP